MDAAFGRLVKELADQRLYDDTLVFFTSDNGPALTRYHPYGSTGPLRAKKGHVYEGGIRVPGILRWPGHASPGQVSDAPISGVDLLPTLCAVTGIPVPRDRAIDGASFLPAVEGDSITRAKPLYWQYNRAGSQVKVALRDGNWKILARLEPLHPTSGPTSRPNRWRSSSRPVLPISSCTIYTMISPNRQISFKRTRIDSP